MADIELVIKIPEELYNDMKSLSFTMFAEDIIASGTPLPKGHDRLIDAGVIWDIYHSNDYDFYEALDSTPTIIEADQGE